MRRALGILLVVVVAAAGGLWAARPLASIPTLQAQPVRVSIATTTTTTAPDGRAMSAPLTGPFQVASVIGKSVTVRKSPGGEMLWQLTNPLYATLPLLFLAKPGAQGEWLEVNLPARPNGSTGFVRAADVRITTVTTQVLVEQRLHRLSVWDNGRLVFETPVAVGKQATPTPNGTYYVQGIVKMDPRGAYGPAILALSAHSEVYKTFAGGDGLVGMHGTNQPELIGQAVSNGCIRMPNAAATEVVRLVAPGSPVVVVP